MHGQPANLNDLIAWSGEIGSDITFFLSQGTAYCTGRGEILQVMDALPNQTFWIVKPTEGLSTPVVFKALNLARIPVRDPLLILDNFYQDKPDYFNDLEETAFEIKPSLKNLKIRLLNAGFEKVIMTGTGTSFFCLGAKKQMPHMEDVLFYKAHFIQRQPNQWYSHS